MWPNSQEIAHFTEETLNGYVIMVVGVMFALWENCCLMWKFENLEWSMMFMCRLGYSSRSIQSHFFRIPPKWVNSVRIGEAVTITHVFNYVFVPFIISTYLTCKLFQFSIISILLIYIPSTISRWDYQWKLSSYSVILWFIIQESS